MKQAFLTGSWLGILVLLAAGQAPVAIGGFDVVASQTAGSFVPPTPDSEGWTSVFGTQMYMPDGTNQSGACSLPLDGSAQWCEVSPFNIGPAIPAVPASTTSGVWPFQLDAAGLPTVSEMQINTVAPIYASGQTALTFDWYWFSGEGQNGSQGVAGGPFNDFAQVVVVDPSTNGIIAVALYVDTYLPQFPVSPTNTCVSGVSGSSFANVYGGPGQTAVAQIPAAFQGAPLLISVVSANQADSNFESTLYVDNFQWVDGSTVNGPFTLVAQTTGSGAGDLLYDVLGVPQAAQNVAVLISGTPAPGGVGLGPVFGLVPDPLLVATLFTIPVPFNPTHYPVTASPFASGPITFGPGSLTAFTGNVWELRAIAYSPTGIDAVSNFQVLNW